MVVTSRESFETRCRGNKNCRSRNVSDDPGNGRLLNIIKGREAAAGEKGVKSKSGKNCRGNHLRMAREKAAGMEEVHAGWYCNVLQDSLNSGNVSGKCQMSPEITGH